MTLLANQALMHYHKRSNIAAGWKAAPHRAHPLLEKAYRTPSLPYSDGRHGCATPPIRSMGGWLWRRADVNAEVWSIVELTAV